MKPDLQRLWSRRALRIGEYVASFALFRLGMAGVGELWTLALQHQSEFNYDMHEPGRLILMGNTRMNEVTSTGEGQTLLGDVKKDLQFNIPRQRDLAFTPGFP